MGALAPVSSWIPEDDLLLKNAVEAGASLESLAKGAVQFSRRFTVRELEDRWFSILYDPVVSVEASTKMLEFERSASTLISKLNKFGHSKDNKSVTGKRKAESIRKCYYALRKRVCSEPFDSMDLSFLVAPTNSTYVGNGDGPLSGNCIPGNPISNPFGLGVSGMDTMTHAFPNNLMDGSAVATSGGATINTFPTGHQNPVEENFLFEQNNIHKEIPHIIEENMRPKDLPEHNLHKAVELGMKSPPAFDQVNGDQSNMCLEFEENKVFNSPVSGCVAPFNNMEYSSPLPIWKTVSAPALPVDIGLEDKDLCAGDTFHLPDDYDAGSTRTSGYNVHSCAKVKMEMAYDDFQIHNSPEGYLEELSNSLLNFTNEEELLFMNADGKDMIDKSYYDGLSSLLLNSPNDACQEQTNNITELETSVAAAVRTTDSSDQCRAEPLDNKAASNCDEQMSYDAPTQMQASVSAANNQFPEYKDGVICCTLNTEDPEIPCNDDVFLPNHRASKASTSQPKFQGANKPRSLSIKGVSNNQRTNNRGPSLMHKERKTAGESHVSSQMIGSHAIQEMGLNPPGSNFGVKSAVSMSDSANVAFRVAGISSIGNQIIAANTSTKTLLPEMRKEETKEMLSAKHLSLTNYSIKRPPLGSTSVKSYAHTNSIIIKEEDDVSAPIRDQESINAELTSMNVAVSEPVVNAPTADQDCTPFESDDDIPCYSDIEALILDMDLDPDDRNFTSSEEVAKYQREGTMRVIIRLEQSAHSYMQRAIASHGALAILYGRHSKHYIKKPEVLLGRATEDMTVDIDLGRESRANKISRKQAIIKLDKGGSFYLKNLGKSSISVNSREVGPKQSISLNSSCLIEIKRMPFIFEMNQTRVKMYLDSIAKNTGTQQRHL